MYEDLNDQVKTTVDSLLDFPLKKYLNQDVIIPCGKFKGRVGKVTYVGYDHSAGVCMMIQPYKLERKGQKTIQTEELLWYDADARTFWPTAKFEFDLEIIDGTDANFRKTD